MRIKSKGKCPNCNRSLRDFRIDLPNSIIQCANCKSEFNPTETFSDSEIVFISKIMLRPNEKEAFLANLGFEKKPIVRTSKIMLWMFIAIILPSVIASALYIYINGQGLLRALGPVVGGGLFIYVIVQSYKSENEPKWIRKR